MNFDGLSELWKSFSAYTPTQIIGVIVIVLIIAAMFAWRHGSASGTDKLAADQAETSEAYEVLIGQIKEIRRDLIEEKKRCSEISKDYEERLKDEREKTEKQYTALRALDAERLADARYEQTYRHALTNQLQVFTLYYDAAHELLLRITAEWPEMPDGFKFEMQGLSTGKEIADRNPLPSRKDGE